MTVGSPYVTMVKQTVWSEFQYGVDLTLCCLKNTLEKIYQFILVKVYRPDMDLKMTSPRSHLAPKNQIRVQSLVKVLNLQSQVIQACLLWVSKASVSSLSKL